MKARIPAMLVLEIGSFLLLVLVLAVTIQGAEGQYPNRGLPSVAALDRAADLAQIQQNSPNYTSEITFTTAFTVYLPAANKNLCIDSGTPPLKRPYVYPGWLPTDYFDYSLAEYHEYSKTVHCTRVIVVIHKDWDNIPVFAGEPVPTNEEFASFVFDTLEYYWQVFQGYPYDRYIVKVLSPYDDQQWISATAIGFLVVSNPNLSSIPWFTAGPNKTYQQLVTHETFHAWNGEIILCEPCHRDLIQPESWFLEGATQYYGYRGTPDDIAFYQRRIGTSWQRYQGWQGSQYDVPLIVMSEKEVTTGEWQYGQNLREKGACVFYLMDKELMGTGKNLDDLMRYMYENYGLTGRRYVSNDVLVALNTITGQNWTEFFDKYVYGTEPLPLDGVFEYLEH